MYYKLRSFGIIICLLLILLTVTIFLTLRQMRQERLNNALFTAIIHNNARAVGALLEQGADANARYVARKHISVWQLLLDSVHIKRHETKEEGPTYLMCAAGLKRTEMVKALLEHSADPNLKNEHGDNALYYALRQQGPILQMLLDYGADPNCRDKYHQTLLMWAVSFDRPESTKILLRYGADPNAIDGNHTVMQHCDGDPTIIHLLKQAGAKR